MYSDNRSVLQLVALLKAHGISHIVLSPGSRNSPLTHSFATDCEFSCYSIVDERSAGFFALGVIQATGKPVAVCCTSGSAVLNLGPSVAEAFYQQLPLIVITADRPTAWIGQMDGQTIPQAGLFREITRRSVHLPIITNKEEEWYCNRLINEALLSVDNGVIGPVHINIPLDEPLFGFNQESLPCVRTIRKVAPAYRIGEEGDYAERFVGYSKRMIIVGQLPPGHDLTELLRRLRESAGVVILAEQLSNVPSMETSTFDTVLYAASKEVLEQLAPELVITLGGHLVSKRLKEFIRSAPISEHWHISPSGEVTDTFQKVTDIVTSDNKTFLEYLVGIPLNRMEEGSKNSTEKDPGIISEDEVSGEGDITTRWKDVKGSTSTEDFQNRWKIACAVVTEPDVDFSDLSSIGELIHALPDNSSLQLGNSNSVRLAQLFEMPPSVGVFCNRGTNGIEGSLSTAVGYAAISVNPTFLLIGDLSFFYDMNGLWNHYRTGNLRIFLNNNGGGEIFGMLPGLNKSEVLHEYIAAAHTTEAKAWAEQQGFLYFSVHSKQDMEKHLPLFTDLSCKKPILLEVFTSMDKNAEQIRSYYHRQKSVFTENNLG